MSRKSILLIILALLVAFVIAAFLFLSPSCCGGRTPDSRIISAIHQVRAVMVNIYEKEGNYDNFNCYYDDMVSLCQEIDVNYKGDDNGEPITAHDTENNSQTVCIYSSLNNSPFSSKGNDERAWYCADSLGRAGFTKVNPRSGNYCIDGSSAGCPPDTIH